jgi:hypothetical protein
MSANRIPVTDPTTSPSAKEPISQAAPTSHMTRPVPRCAGLFDKLLPPGGITLTLCLIGNQQRRMPLQIARREPQIACKLAATSPPGHP